MKHAKETFHSNRTRIFHLLMIFAFIIHLATVTLLAKDELLGTHSPSAIHTLMIRKALIL